MIIAAIILFSLTILLGIFLLSYILQNRNTPKSVALIHGGFAATALVILIIYALSNRPSPLISIILFALAALGGITLLYRDLSGQTVPKWMALGHGLTALAGFIFLIMFAFF